MPRAFPLQCFLLYGTLCISQVTVSEEQMCRQTTSCMYIGIMVIEAESVNNDSHLS